jgi:predicted ATPase
VAQQPIFTPDRRLRVFVSSTLRELALERMAAREAISSLHLAPVLFEQGARPHAPRDLYAAYVDQCDVFVGIYWQSYGWVAPRGAISGLEDEYELAQGKPKLLYIKEPAVDREARLSTLIRRIEEEAGPAYRTFSTVEELRRFVSDDLALLLTERFHASADEPEQRSALPARTTSFVGRDDELQELLRLVERSDVRLVTLTGPGGIGKTRLALEAARQLAPRFHDGAAYVALDRLADPELVPAAIADAVGLPSLGPDEEGALARRLREQRLLLVLDNFEHVLVAAPLVTGLLEASEHLEVLATSREPLRLQGEHEYGVPPLEDAPILFMERVRAIRPNIVWNEDNVRAAHEICRRVDHLPLAVELVAGGARMFSPSVLVEHLESSLDAPSSGRRDAPARQQTVRATIDWSYGLLNEQECDLFERLGVFAGSFTIEAAGSVAGGNALTVLSTLSALVDKSLLVHAASESETRFRMLRVVSEYAAERLRDRADEDDICVAHAEYYAELARAAYAGLRGNEQRGWKDILDFERENIRRALAHLARAGRVDEAADLVWSVWVYWLTGHFLEGRKLVAELLTSTSELSERGRARLQTVAGVLAALQSDLGTAHAQLGQAIEWFQEHDDNEGKASALGGLAVATAPLDPERARSLMLESASLFAAIGDAWGEAIVLGSLGWLDTGRGDFSEERLFERAYDLARYVDDEVTTAHTATNLAELRLAMGHSDEAREALDIALTAHEAVRLYDGLSYGLEAAARFAWSDGRSEDAARLLGAADGLRDEVGLPIWGPRLSRFETLVRFVRIAVGDAAFAAAWAEGRALSFDAALATARAMLHGAKAGTRF